MFDRSEVAIVLTADHTSGVWFDFKVLVVAQIVCQLVQPFVKYVSRKVFEV